jgi:hypothetical protein
VVLGHASLGSVVVAVAAPSSPVSPRRHEGLPLAPVTKSSL